MFGPAESLDQCAQKGTRRRPKARHIIVAFGRLQAKRLVHGPQPVVQSRARIHVVVVVRPYDRHGGCRAHDICKGRGARQFVEERVRKPMRVTSGLVSQRHDASHDGG